MENKTFKIYENAETDCAYISEDTIAIIAALAATEVEGVASMAGGITKDAVFKFGRKRLSAGVHVICEEMTVKVQLSLVVKMGVSIPETAKNVQDRVKASIENMTSMSVAEVDVKIANVEIGE